MSAAVFTHAACHADITPFQAGLGQGFRQDYRRMLLNHGFLLSRPSRNQTGIPAPHLIVRHAALVYRLPKLRRVHFTHAQQVAALDLEVVAHAGAEGLRDVAGAGEEKTGKSVEMDAQRFKKSGQGTRKGGSAGFTGSWLHPRPTARFIWSRLLPCLVGCPIPPFMNSRDDRAGGFSPSSWSCAAPFPGRACFGDCRSAWRACARAGRASVPPSRGRRRGRCGGRNCSG